jgi:adenylyltransferase/sulfurtransferase
MSNLPDLSSEEIARYGRHLILPEVGPDGQKKIKAARVLCVGAGGLGSPALMYLAAAGIGTIGIVDFDVVQVSNLQRQIVHGTPDVGRPKLGSAKDRLIHLNPDVRVVLHNGALKSGNAIAIIQEYDVVVDGTDNFPARYLVNDVCVLLDKPNVYGAIFRFEGQASVFAAAGGPCYRCLFPEPPPPGLVPSCAEAGVFGVLPGVIGTIQATEALKLVLGIGESLVGRLLTYDALRLRFEELRIPRDPACPVCGVNPTIRAPIDYEQFCGVPPADSPESGTPEPRSAPDFHISPVELKARWDHGDRPFLLDVREPVEFELVRLPDATLIPLGDLVARQDELDPDIEIIVYCHHGVRSMRAVAYLRNAGFTGARNLRGGIDAWTDQVDPAVPRY